MIQKLHQILKMDFIKSTSFVFVVNNIANVLNYVTVIIVIALLKDDFGVWVSTTGFLALLSVPTSSLMAILVGKFSKLSENNPSDAFAFYNSFIKLIIKYKYQISILLLITFLITVQVLKIENVAIPLFLVISIFTALIANINQNFLLGTMQIKSFSAGVLIGAISKFVFTIIFIQAGLGLISLPLGLVISSLLTLFSAIYFIRKTFSELGLDVKDDLSITNTEVDLFSQGKNTLKAMVYFAILSLFLNIDIVLSRSLLSQDQNNTYALISTFGQIAHFGPISLTALIIPFASRKNHKIVFYISNAMITVTGIFISILFYFFGSNILDNLEKISDSSTVWLIFIYSIFIMMFNLIYVNINYLISRLNFKASMPLLIAVIAYISGLSLLAISDYSVDNIRNMIYFSTIFISNVAMLLIFYCVSGISK